MSESLDSDGILDIPFHGQALTPLYKEISEYQQLLDEDILSDEDRYAFIESLDNRWPYMNHTLTITGNIWLPEYTSNEEDERPTMRMQYVEDKEVESLGFGSLITGQNDNGAETRAIGHYMILDPERIQKRPMEAILRVKQIFARPEDIMITYPFTEETEDTARLLYFFEETIAEIDSVFNEYDNECDVVSALGNVEFPIRSDDTAEELSLITKYINAQLKFDEKVPYLMDFEGFCYAVGDNGSLMQSHASEGTVMAYALGIETLSNFVTDESSANSTVTEISFGLRIEILHEIKDYDTGKQYVIPINDGFSMQSIRPYIRAGINSMVAGD